MKPTHETYDEWQLAYQELNTFLFGGQLPDCLITLQREKNSMGYFSKQRFVNRHGEKTDEIALNPAFWASHGMREALQTLGHEMTHLWQFHFGSPGRGRYHNAQWADKMESIGLMPSHTGEPGGKRTGDYMADYIIEGGRFEEAIDRLTARGFEMKWMDRFVAVTKRRPTQGWSSDKPNELTPASLAARLNLDPEVAESLAEDVDYTRVTQAKQGNRSKYTCPGCGTNLWGRPGLNIACGDCDVTFDEL